MKRIVFSAVIAALMLVMASTAVAQTPTAQVRVIHASPDAPAVDVWVDGTRAFANLSFTDITEYATLPADSYRVRVVPAGQTEPAVIDANIDVMGGTNYTVVATGRLADIAPLILVDDSPVPAAGQAHVRFVHLSPDAPAVDIAVAGGPVLFDSIAFRQFGDYTPVDAGTYDLEARVAGTDNVALSVPGVSLTAGTIYTVYAVGFAAEEPALSVIVSQDAAAMMPAVLPAAGEAGTGGIGLLLAAAGAALVLGGFALRRRLA